MPVDILIKSFLRNILLPPIGFVLLIVAGLVLLRRHRRTGWTFIVCGVAALWLTSTPYVADRLVQLSEHYPPLDLKRDTGAQAVVILGGGFRRDAPEYSRTAPSDSTLQRLTYGAMVARATQLPVLVSGGTPEGETMQWFLENVFKVPVAWHETTSRDTRENARFSAALLRPQHVTRVVLVTSSMHMTRAVAEFRAAGFQVVPAPADMLTHDDRGVLAFVPNIAAARRSHQVFYEWLGNSVRRVRAGFN